MSDLQQHLLNNESDLSNPSKVSLDEENINQNDVASPAGNKNQPIAQLTSRENEPNPGKEEEVRKPQSDAREIDNKQNLEGVPVTQLKNVKTRSILKNSLYRDPLLPLADNNKPREGRGSSVSFSNVNQVHQLEMWYYQDESIVYITYHS